MSQYEPIIDVTPVSYSSNRASSAQGHASTHAQSSTQNASSPSWHSAGSGQASSDSARTYVGQAFYGMPFGQMQSDAVAVKSVGSAMSGLLQMAIGAGLVMIGIPMLILPGPGLLSILGGMVLGAHGARKLFG